MGLPNGYGTCYRLSGKRRLPFIAESLQGGLMMEKTLNLLPSNLANFLLFFLIKITPIFLYVSINN